MHTTITLARPFTLVRSILARLVGSGSREQHALRIYAGEPLQAEHIHLLGHLGITGRDLDAFKRDMQTMPLTFRLANMRMSFEGDCEPLAQLAADWLHGRG